MSAPTVDAAVAPDASAPPPQLIYTAQQAAVRLGVDDEGHPIKSARWLSDEARAGRIPCRRIGGTLCWSEQDLRDLVEANYCDPADYGRKPAR